MSHESLNQFEIEKGLDDFKVHSRAGVVRLPLEAKLATLTGFPINKDDMPSINLEALDGILIETEGSVIHLCDNRYIVLAKVCNGYLPFYRSAQGTGGKHKGEWYPFFGHTGNWLIKGEITSKGEMNYSQVISDVQKLLNENLRLPDTKNLDRKDLGNIPMDNIKDFQAKNKYVSHRDMIYDYVKQVTGYDPEKLFDYYPYDDDPQLEALGEEWIRDIVRAIDNTLDTTSEN